MHAVAFRGCVHSELLVLLQTELGVPSVSWRRVSPVPAVMLDENCLHKGHAI